jgi:hypothetical protein
LEIIEPITASKGILYEFKNFKNMFRFLITKLLYSYKGYKQKYLKTFKTKKMKKTIEKALMSGNLNYRIIADNESQTIFNLGMELENGNYDCYIDLRTEENQVLIYTISATKIPTSQRVRAAEYISRANYNLIIGNFELNFEDGKIRYKTSYLYDTNFPNSEEVFLKNMSASFHTMDKYIAGIMSIIYANVSPESAVNDVEKVLDPCLN